MIRKLLFAALLFVTILGHAQTSVTAVRVQDTLLFTANGTLAINDPIGTTNDVFEYIITGAPTTSSVTLNGCMRGGTCQVVDVYTGTANVIRPFASGPDYDKYTVTWAVTGGTAPTLKVNWNGVVGSTGGTSTPECPNTVFAAGIATGAQTLLITGVPGRKIRICSLLANNTNVTVGLLKLSEGTGALCVTGLTQFTGQFSAGTNTNIPAPPVMGPSFGWTILTPGDSVCATSSTATSVEMTATYAVL